MDGVLSLTVAAAGAAMDADLVNSGTEALQTLREEVGAGLLTGTGANICAGGEVHNFAKADDRGACLHEMVSQLNDFVHIHTRSHGPPSSSQCKAGRLGFVLAAPPWCVAPWPPRDPPVSDDEAASLRALLGVVAGGAGIMVSATVLLPVLQSYK
ncbi:hypothetical protein [Rhodococcus koreensis]|uniref:hypothetical protein n=1 Tax=Rhodococcus koreensis TaxID=99653 RepID=UPI003670BA1C